MDAIFRWLARLLAKILEKVADPSLQTRLDAYNARVATMEAQEKAAVQAEADSKAAYALSVARRAGLEQQLRDSEGLEAESKGRLVTAQERIKVINDEAEIAKKKLDDLTGGDRVRVGL